MNNVFMFILTLILLIYFFSLFKAFNRRKKDIIIQSLKEDKQNIDIYSKFIENIQGYSLSKVADEMVLIGCKKPEKISINSLTKEFNEHLLKEFNINGIDSNNINGKLLLKSRQDFINNFNNLFLESLSLNEKNEK